MNEQQDSKPQEPGNKLILIVDDDENVIEYLITLLQHEGFRTKSAMDGKIALKRLKEEKTDLILLDMMMPNVSGFEMIKALQGDEQLRQIPVMVITAKVSDRTTWDLIKAEPNVTDVVKKPIRPHQFVRQVHAVLKTLSPEEKRMDESVENKKKKTGPQTWELPPAFRDKKKDL